MPKALNVLKISREINPGGTSQEAKELKKVGVEMQEVSASDQVGLNATLKDAEILFFGGAPITRAMMEASPKLIAVFFPTVGYDPVDLKAATENNILVVNNPSFEWCVEEVSNHAITLILACAKKVKILDKLVSQGHWADAKTLQNPMGSIYGQTLGIIGCGAVGRMVAGKAKVFGLNIIGYDPYISHPYLAKENGIRLTTLDEVLTADYITLHPDLNETSFHLINDRSLANIKPSAYIINTSRGKVIDEVALVKALEQKKIAGAGMDVFEIEPLPKDSPLTNMDNVITLSHSASYSDYAFEVAFVSIAKEVGRILAGKWPLNPVNKQITPRIKLEQGSQN